MWTLMIKLLISAQSSMCDKVECQVQVVIAVAEKYMRSADPRFPVGRTRLETVGVVACAIIMTIATIEVIQSAAQDLLAGFLHGAPTLYIATSSSACGLAAHGADLRDLLCLTTALSSLDLGL